MEIVSNVRAVGDGLCRNIKIIIKNFGPEGDGKY